MVIGREFTFFSPIGGEVSEPTQQCSLHLAMCSRITLVSASTIHGAEDRTWVDYVKEKILTPVIS